MKGEVGSALNILFVHQNFPGQFGPLASYLAAQPGYRVAAICEASARSLPEVSSFRYSLSAEDISATHVFARRFHIECKRAEQVLYAAIGLQSSGFRPDVVLAHHGWGETLPLRSVFPEARLVTYFEFFYTAKGADVGFDPAEGPLNPDREVALRAKNAAALLALVECDVGLSPTRWQRSTFPPEFQGKIRVCHEGVDTQTVAPDPGATIALGADLVLGTTDEVITFVARDLEPIRGYPVFMRALPRILRERPRAHILIVGGDGTSYGASPPENDTWKAAGLRAVSDAIDHGRVHFLGRLAYADYLNVLLVSSVHVYLSHPFVLSWSLIEAMSAGCAVVAADTAPCREVIDGSNGLLVDPLDDDAVARAVVSVLAGRHDARALGSAARNTVLRLFDRQECLVRQHRILLGTDVDSPCST